MAAMNTIKRRLLGSAASWLSLVLTCSISSWALAIPSFQSTDNRLPNPGRPYEMTSGTVFYDAPSFFAIHDLEFQPSNPAQLSVPSLRSDGRYKFDSTFDITYRAIVSAGLGPPREVTGAGNARAVGVSRPEFEASSDFIFANAQVFDTELISLNLFGLSAIPETMLRESPTLPSTGVIIREDQCPVCLAPVTFWRIASFFDIYTEFSHGAGWFPADKAIHVEQAPDGFLSADYNHNGAVDASDYVVWRKSLGQIGAGLAADGDWSGRVDQGDYAVWRTHFGRTAASRSSAGAAATAPEPATWLLLWMGMVAASCGLARSRTPR